MIEKNKSICDECGIKLSLKKRNIGTREGIIIRYLKFIKIIKWNNGLCDKCYIPKNNSSQNEVKGE